MSHPMACLDMYNNNNQKAPPMSPRISFSNDFAESQYYNHSHHHHHHQHHHNRSEPSNNVSSDFEFSVSSYSMMSADELFFKGRLLPFKDTCTNQKTTLRDELLAGEDDDVSVRPRKGGSSTTTRWRELLGLRKSHNGSRKSSKNDGFVEKRPSLVQEERHVSKSSHELVNDE